jgi:alpha-beta hydrolase superfamily lysophospholipase
MASASFCVDYLGEPYQCLTLPLAPDFEGEQVATLVRRRAERSTGRAVLYLHGFIDYFFQTHLADWYVERGFDFYALDLRKYGRSLRPNQTLSYCARIEDYFEELDAAIHQIRSVDGARSVLLNAHSTGGLISCLWAHQNPGKVDGLFLNSPFFDLNLPLPVRTLGMDALTLVAGYSPLRTVAHLSGLYAESLHHSRRGEWKFEERWKPLADFPVRAGWLKAIRVAQRRLQRGLDVQAPALVMSSTASVAPGRTWDDALTRADAVLDAHRIAALAHKVGRHVTVVRIPGGMHDLLLSKRAAREETLRELERWMKGYLP